MARQSKSQQSVLANIRSEARASGGLGGQIVISGIEELAKELNILPGKLVSQVLTRGLEKGGQVVANRAEHLAPQGKTGRLAESIRVRRRQINSGKLVAGVDVYARRSKATPGGYYAHLVELGHDIFKTTRRGKYFIKHYGGERFMRPAIEQKRQEVISIVLIETKKALDRFYAGKIRV